MPNVGSIADISMSALMNQADVDNPALLLRMTIEGSDDLVKWAIVDSIVCRGGPQTGRNGPL